MYQSKMNLLYDLQLPNCIQNGPNYDILAILSALWLNCENDSRNAERITKIHRGSNMSTHVLFNLLNEFGTRDKMRIFIM